MIDTCISKDYNMYNSPILKEIMRGNKMFNRIFGGSDAEQLQFLEIRSIITIVALVVAFIASFFSSEALGLIAVVMLFIWGWNVTKNWFGITTLGAIFSGNVVIGVIIFMFYLIVAYLVGIVFAFLGVGRWIYLKMKYRN